MQISRPQLAPIFAVLFAFAAAGCADSATGPAARPAEQAFLSSTTYGATLLECPTETSRSASGTIGILGGVLELDGHRVTIPFGAVLLPTKFTITAPASNYVEIDIRAGGSEHFTFEKPVALTVSYERCTRSNIDHEDLRIYYVDGESKEILEDLGGADDKELRVVTTSTDHLSDYALGAPH